MRSTQNEKNINKFTIKPIELTACNINKILQSLLIYIYDYLTFSDLLQIRHVYNKYLSIHVLWRYLSSSNRNASFQCNKFIFLGIWDGLNADPQRFGDPDFWALFGRIYG
eukprot:497763_1